MPVSDGGGARSRLGRYLTGRSDGSGTIERASISVDGATIDYQVRRSRRRMKTIQIAIDPQEGVVVSTPLRATPQEVAGVVLRRAGWILNRANSIVLQPARARLVGGDLLPYLGRQVRLIVEPAATKRPRVTLADWSVTVTVAKEFSEEERGEAIAGALERWYRQQAAEWLDGRVRWWAPSIGQAPKRVIVRDQRRRWGSCSADGVIRLNWRLIQLDPSLIDYVVVHELAHLLERNHAPTFWQVVARVLPDYQWRRRQLKEAGASVVL